MTALQTAVQQCAGHVPPPPSFGAPPPLASYNAYPRPSRAPPPVLFASDSFGSTPVLLEDLLPPITYEERISVVELLRKYGAR